MMENLLEVIVAGIILATGAGVGLMLLGADPNFAVSLINGVTKLGIYILTIGVLVAIPVALFQAVSQ